MKPELLSPAGNLEKLKIACLYGADAIYIGGQNFGLRSGADNFSFEEIEEGSSFCKKFKVKLYVVLNAFLHNKDLIGIADYVKFLEKVGVDALIVSDLGVITNIKKNCSIAIHLSTQASCLNSSSASVWKDLGVQRIITGRELSVAEGGKIKRETGLEVEMFIHGAMCSAYSGHCSISNYTAGRDSNRGGCKQSCRFDYKLDNSSETTSLMSSKDLNGVRTLDAFIEEGIDSVKVEGRMKSNLYVAASCKGYRNMIDAHDNLNNEIQLESAQKQALADLELYPNRGYTEASLVSPAGEDSIIKHSNLKHNKFTYAGTIFSTAAKKAWIQLRNPVKKGDTIQIISLEGKNIDIELNTFKNFKGQTIERARQDQVISISTDEVVRAGMVLCKV